MPRVGGRAAVDLPSAIGKTAPVAAPGWRGDG